METRKITIVSTKTQKKSVIMSGAETLGELKRDLDAHNIDYDDMTFYEGTSKTELKTNDSVLPKDVPYTNRTTGETKITNELVFMLTNTNKKIRSGAMNRAEAYKAIKKNNLQKACIEAFGKNYTQCATANLISLIEENTSVKSEEELSVKSAVENLVTVLYNRGLINAKDKAFILAAIPEKADTESSYDDSEIEDMFADMIK